MTLKSDINTLIDPDADREKLPAADPRAPIPTRIGRADIEIISRSAPKINNWTEMITVWSSLILTEDGAFEKPPGWPESGVYPGMEFELNTEDPYYEQRRVHTAIYRVGDSLIEQNYLVTVAAPYAGMVNSIESALSLGVMHLHLDAMPTSDPNIQSRLNYFFQLGVV